MGKLIHFPSGKEIKGSKDETDKEFVGEISDDGIAISQHMLDVIEDELKAIDMYWLQGLNMREEEFVESRDAYVIINLFYALLMRYVGLEHSLHKDLNNLYIKIKKMQKVSDDTT